MIRKKCVLFFCQQFQRSDREWSTLDGLSNVNETLILSNIPLYDVCLLFVCSLLSLSKFGLCFLLPLEKKARFIFSLFPVCVHAAVTSQTQKHQTNSSTTHSLTWNSAILNNSLTFSAMRTNEHRKEESTLTAREQKQETISAKRTNSNKNLVVTLCWCV